MKRDATIVFLLCAIALVMGCTSKRGIIELNTRPPGATVYLNKTKQGVTPVEFEYDFRVPAKLTIEEDGYYPKKELLDEGWVVNEFLKGNYVVGHFTIQGERKKAWKVRTIRKLQRIKDK